MRPSDPLTYDVPIIAMRYAQQFFQFMQGKGIGKQAIIKDTAIDAAVIEQADAFLSINQVISMLSRAEWLAQDERLPFQFGQALDLPAHGLLGFALVGLQDHRQLIHMIVQYLRVRLPLMDMRLIDKGEQHVAIQLCDRWNLGPIRAFMTKIYAGSIYALASAICNDLVFEFDFPSQLSGSDWRQIAPRAGMRFGTDCNQVILPLSPSRPSTADLDYLLTRAKTQAKLQSAQMLLREPNDTLVRVRELITKHPGRGSGLEQIAHQLGMSDRSLRHHLTSAGVSFRELRNDIRRDFAIQFLTETSIPLETIAEKLGFCDQASFTRAFRSWSGRTPGEMRRLGK